MVRLRGGKSTRSSHIVSILGLIATAIALSGCASGRLQKGVLLPGKGINVYAAGDIAECRGIQPEQTAAAKTAALIAERLANDSNAVVLTLGDNTYPVGKPAEFLDCYGPTWGRFKERTRPSPGNHDYATPQAAGYYGYFGAAAGPDRRGYYSFRIGNWHVISLNSNLKPAQHQAQLAWLAKELEQDKSRCTLAYWHHPLYSSGGHGNYTRMRDAWKMLHAAHADLVLTAHDHDYERFAPLDADGARDDERGIRQFVVGTGGARLTPFAFPAWHSEAADNATHGVLRLVLKNDGYEWEFLPADSGGFTDRGAARCH